LIAGAVATIALTAFAGYASVVGFGLGPCGGSDGDVEKPSPARDSICTIIEGHKPGTVFGPGHASRSDRPLLWMALPLLAAVAGVLVAAATRKPAWARAGGVIAASLVVLPWAALAVSRALSGS
jgi:hypothetical protein